MFAEERLALRPLPLEPFRYYQYGERTVHLDGCIEVEAAYYGAPQGWIGRRGACSGTVYVCVYSTQRQGSCCASTSAKSAVAMHSPGGCPVAYAALAATVQLLHRARHAGHHIGALRDQINRVDGEIGGKRILGVLALAQKHGAPTVDDAAKSAIELGAPRYRFLRRYLERRPAAPLTLRQVDPLIRQLALYRDRITQNTGDPT